jgi:Uma2 family endonuclease
MTAALQLPRVFDDAALLDEKADWTVDDLATLPKDLRYELIDGRLILPSPTSFHQDLCVDLVTMLRPGCPADYRAVIDISLEINPRNEPRPDVAVVRKAFGMRSPLPVEGALLVVEVISPTSHFRDMYNKTKLFAACGIKHYWVVDPTFEAGVVLTEFRVSVDGSYEIAENTNKIFETELPYPITIDVPALTALRDDYRKAQDEQ